MPSAPTVFISYSHKDKAWKDRLLPHLRISQKEGLLEIWDDRRIGAGSNWRSEIRKAIETADIGILLISADFLISDFIRDEEIPRMLEQRSKNGMRLVPVMVRSCDWQIVSWLASIQVLPTGARPLADFRGDRRDSEMAAIAREVRRLLDSVSQRSLPTLIPDRLRLSQPSPSPAKILSVTAYTDHLSHLYNSTHELLTSVFAKREFALLNVRNTSTRSLSQVVARCRFEEEDIEDFCIWSLKAGSPPFEPGTHEADLSAGNSRLLVIARGFGDEELWARLPPEGEPLYIISRVHAVSNERGIRADEIMFVSNSGTVRALPKKISITVTFQAADFYQEERFILGFNHGKPTITRP